MVLPVFVLVTDAGAARAGGEEGQCPGEGDSSQRKREKGARKGRKASPHSVPQAWRGLSISRGLANISSLSLSVGTGPGLGAEAEKGGTGNIASRVPGGMMSAPESRVRRPEGPRRERGGVKRPGWAPTGRAEDQGKGKNPRSSAPAAPRGCRTRTVRPDFAREARLSKLRPNLLIAKE